ncbi:hypothetical protein [Streptomyces deserti]
MATRFDLADGRTTWSRPVDATPDASYGHEGTIIGTAGDRVFADGADERERAEGGLPTRYTIEAPAADTGKVLWQTETGDGDMASAPAQRARPGRSRPRRRGHALRRPVRAVRPARRRERRGPPRPGTPT